MDQQDWDRIISIQILIQSFTLLTGFIWDRFSLEKELETVVVFTTYRISTKFNWCHYVCLLNRGQFLLRDLPLRAAVAPSCH